MARYGYRPCALVNASVPAPCSSCGAPLAADQRYCVACGSKRPAQATPEPPLAAGGSIAAAATPAPGSETVRVARTRSRRLEERFGWLPAPQPAAASVLITLACGVLVGNTVDTSAGSILGPPPAIVSSARPSTDAAVEDEPAPEAEAGDDLAAAPPPALAAGGSAAADLPPLGAAGGDSLAAPSGGSALGPSAGTSSSPPSTDDAGGDDAGAQDESPKPDASFRGTVVHVAPAAQSYTVTTDKTDKLISVHAREQPKVGQTVDVDANNLLNGTFTEVTTKVVGDDDKKKAEFDGIVTFVDEAERTYAVSDRGVSLLVRVPAPSPDEPEGKPDQSKASDIAPLGTKAKVGVRIDQVGDRGKDVELRQTRLIILDEDKDDPQPIGKKPIRAFVTGIVRKIREKEREVTISADDRGESERNIVLKLPEPLDVSAFRPTKVFLFAVKISQDGVYTVDGASNNSNRRVADDKAKTQGDLQLPGAKACERAEGSGLAALVARGRCDDAAGGRRRR